MTRIVQSALRMLGRCGTYRVPDTEHPRCKNVQKDLPYTLQESEELPLRPDEWMSLHKVRIANNVYTGMMDACNIQISILAAYFMLYHSSFLSGNS